MKALESVSHFLKTRGSKSLVDEESRVIVCLDCPENHLECVEKQDAVAGYAAADLGLQFFIVLQFESHDTHGKPADWLLIKDILQPAEPHEIFRLSRTADSPETPDKERINDTKRLAS